MWPCEEALTRVTIRRPWAECLGLDFRGRGLRSTALLHPHWLECGCNGGRWSWDLRLCDGHHGMSCVACGRKMRWKEPGSFALWNRHNILDYLHQDSCMTGKENLISTEASVFLAFILNHLKVPFHFFCVNQKLSNVNKFIQFNLRIHIHLIIIFHWVLHLLSKDAYCESRECLMEGAKMTQ